MNATAERNPIAPSQLGNVHRLSPKIGRNRSIRIHAYAPSNAPQKGETIAKLIEDRPYVHGVVAGCYETDMLVDYGASTSVISRSVMEEIERKLETTLPRLHNDVHIRSYGGHSVPSEGTVMMPLTIGDHTFKTPFTITPYETTTKVILGTTLLVKARIGLSWKQDTIYLTIGNNQNHVIKEAYLHETTCLLYTSPSPRDKRQSRMPSSA